MALHLLYVIKNNLKMRKITLFLFLIAICFSQVSFAQKIKFKKGVVTVDGTPVMNYDASLTIVELSSLDDKNTIILKQIRDSEFTNGEVYSKITFIPQKKHLTSRSYIFTKKLLVKKLLKSKIIDVKGTFNESKIDNFIARYDEKVEKEKKEIRIIID